MLYRKTPWGPAPPRCFAWLSAGIARRADVVAARGRHSARVMPLSVPEQFRAAPCQPPPGVPGIRPLLVVTTRNNRPAYLRENGDLATPKP